MINIKDIKIQFKEKYKIFINQSSDLLTICNIYGQFFTNECKIQNDRFLMTNFVKYKISKFCKENFLNQKSFFDGISFIFQVFRTCKLIFSDDINHQLYEKLNFFKIINFQQSQALIDIITFNSTDKCAKKVIHFDVENQRPKIYLETVEFQKAKPFYSSFVNLSAEFYIYRNIFESNGFFKK